MGGANKQHHDLEIPRLEVSRAPWRCLWCDELCGPVVLHRALHCSDDCKQADALDSSLSEGMPSHTLGDEVLR